MVEAWSPGLQRGNMRPTSVATWRVILPGFVHEVCTTGLVVVQVLLKLVVSRPGVVLKRVTMGAT